MTKGKTEEKDTIYLVPNAHFDALWVFTKEEHLYKKELKREGERIELKMKPFEIVSLKVELSRTK